MSATIRDHEFDDYELLKPVLQRTPETEAASAKAREELNSAVEKLFAETH